MAMPNEPACPPRPEPSSYAQTGVLGNWGCRRRWICLSVKRYSPGAAGVATTMPAPGTGSGSANGRRLTARPPARAVVMAAAAAPERAAVTLSAAPAMPYLRNPRRVVSVIVGPFR